MIVVVAIETPRRSRPCRRSMKRRSFSSALLLACALMIVCAPIARAARNVVRPETFSFEAELPTKHGWAAYVRADDHRHVELLIHHYDEEVRPYVTMAYRTIGHVDRHGISADFGRFGRVDLAFPGRSKRELFAFPDCKGSKPEVNQYGEMHGTIDFEALGGLIGFHRTHAEGQTHHSPRRICVPKPNNVRLRPGGDVWGRPPRVEEEEFVDQVFLARGHLQRRTIDVYAIDHSGEVIDLAASSTRRFGSVLVQTTIHAPDSEETRPGADVDFTVLGRGPRPQAANVQVAPPFTGSARYRTTADGSTSWLGDLSVPIPGEGELPLVGPEFHSILCGYLDTKRQRACERLVAPPHTG